MSKKSKIGHFFLGVLKAAPSILAMNPATAAIALPITAAIMHAEAAHGAGTGSEKLAQVVAAANNAADAVNIQTGTIVVDKTQLDAVIRDAVAAIIAAQKVHPEVEA